MMTSRFDIVSLCRAIELPHHQQITKWLAQEHKHTQQHAKTASHFVVHQEVVKELLLVS
jgi:hypothetical protein